MKTNIRLAITITISLLLFVGICMLAEIDSDVSVWVILVGVLVSVGVVEFLYNRHMEKVAEREAQHMKIDVKNNTAIMLQRSKISASFLSYEPVHYNSYKYNPSQTVYTGVSVGGVHTGGFHTTEAYVSEHAGPSSGRCHVFVRYSDGPVEIEKIKLTPELLDEAMKDKRLKNFIKKDYISLRNDKAKLTKAEENAFKRAIENGDTAARYNAADRAIVERFLEASDVRYIVNWVRGE